MKRSKLFAKLQELAKRNHGLGTAQDLVMNEPGLVPRIADHKNREVYWQTVLALTQAVDAVWSRKEGLTVQISLEKAAESFERYWDHYSNIPCGRDEAQQWN